jgi:MinD superfamily P-loop ATPase
MNVVIASGKGGTGKTLLATNLAAYLAENNRVLLCDLDVEEPNALLFFKGMTIRHQVVETMIPTWDEDRCRICDVCHQVCAFHAIVRLGSEILVFPQLCHSCHACSELCPEQALPMAPQRTGEIIQKRSSYLELLEGRLDVGTEQAVPVIKKTKEVARELCHEITFCLFDAPPGTSCPVIEANRDADLVILVTDPTPFGLHDLKLAVSAMQALRKPVAVVINRTGLGNNEVYRYCREESLPIIAEIPDHIDIAHRYAKGHLVYRHIPAVRVQLEKISKYLHTMANRLQT